MKRFLTGINSQKLQGDTTHITRMSVNEKKITNIINNNVDSLKYLHCWWECE